MLDAVKRAMWTETSPEQRRLTTQLARNTFYFGLAIFVIRKYGDRLAI